MVVGGVILALPLLHKVFGPGYTEGAQAFRLLLLSIGFIFIYGAIHNIMVACDYMKVEIWIMAVAASLNIVLNFFLIPLHGLVGSALATVSVEGLILLAGFFVVYKLRVFSDLWPVL